jgi:hypothetical protein
MSGLDESIDQKASLEARANEAAPWSRFRVALKDVVFWVFGAAVFLDLTRRAWRGNEFLSSAIDYNTYHYFVWGTFIIAEIVGLRLGMQLIGLARGKWTIPDKTESDQVVVGPVLRAIFWRGIVLALLFAYVAEQTGSVAAHTKALAALWHEMSEKRIGFGLGTLTPSPPDFSFRDEMRAPLVPVCGLLMILGLLAGIRPPAARSSGRPRETWIAIPLAGLAGVGLAAGFMLVPHLVLIAIEMVSIAMTNTTKTPESLADRINQAAILGVFALAAVMATAGWISFDLRRASRGEPAIAPSRLGLLYRLGSFAAMLGLAWFLVNRTIPDVHADLYRGFAGVIGGEEILIMGVGFAGLCAGIVARSIVRRGVVDPLSSGRKASSIVSQFLWAGLLVAVIFIAVSRSMRDLPELSEYVPVGLKTWMETAVVLWNKVHHIAYPFATNSHVLLLPAVIWGLVVSFRLCGPLAPDRAAAFDGVARSSENLKRFWVPFAALSVLCLCALPTLFVMGLVVYHLRLMLLI